MTEYTTEVKLVAKRSSTYTNYVFKDLNTNNYIFCTRLPNWQIPEIDIDDTGYLQYREVKAGDEYINPDTGECIIYRYDNAYLINFVKKSEIIKNKEIML